MTRSSLSPKSQKGENMIDKIKQLVVDEFTSPDLKAVESSTALAEVVSLMEESDIRHMPVVEEGKIKGIISDRDIMLSLKSTPIDELNACDVMTTDPYIVTPETPMEEVALYLSSNKIGSAVVCSNTEDYIGIFTNTDALNALVEVLRGEM